MYVRISPLRTLLIRRYINERIILKRGRRLNRGTLWLVVETREWLLKCYSNAHCARVKTQVEWISYITQSVLACKPRGNLDASMSVGCVHYGISVHHLDVDFPVITLIRWTKIGHSTLSHAIVNLPPTILCGQIIVIRLGSRQPTHVEWLHPLGALKQDYHHWWIPTLVVRTITYKQNATKT